MSLFTIISDGPIEELFAIVNWLRWHSGHHWFVETMEFVPLMLDFSPLSLGVVKQIEVLLEQDKLPTSILLALFTDGKPARDESMNVRYSLN